MELSWFRTLDDDIVLPSTCATASNQTGRLIEPNSNGMKKETDNDKMEHTKLCTVGLIGPQTGSGVVSISPPSSIRDDQRSTAGSLGVHEEKGEELEQMHFPTCTSTILHQPVDTSSHRPQLDPTVRRGITSESADCVFP